MPRPSDAPTPHILIAGAGIGGLAAALALLQRGFRVTVFEQAAELKEIGAGVQIAPNGVRVLYHLGLEEPVNRLGVVADAKEVRIWNSGQSWSLFDLGSECVARYGVPYFLMHRADLHSMLLEGVLALDPDAIRLDSQCQDFVDRGDRVQLTLSQGDVHEGDALIGADGLHSAIRSGLFGPAQPKFTGGACWRGVIDIDKLPPHLRRPVGVNWLGPHGHVILYPVRAGRLLNFVGHIEREDWATESWTEVGSHEEMRADYQGWHDDIQTIVQNVEVPYKWALFLRDPLPQWSRGNVTLLGDACHATLPYLAQGANMALEDGLVLARALSDVASIPEALQRYEAARVERTTRIVRRSSENLGRFHNDALSNPANAERYVATEWAPEKVRERYEWLFSYDAVNVPL